MSAGHASPGLHRYSSPPGHRYRPNPALQIVVAECHHVCRTRLIRIDRVQLSSGSHRSPEPVRHVVVAEATVSAGHAIAGITPLQLSAGSQISPEPGLQIVVAEATTSVHRTRLIRIDPYSSHPGHIGHPNPYDTSSLPQATVSAGHASAALHRYSSPPGHRYRPNPALQIVVAECHHVCRTRLIRIDPYSSHPGHRCRPSPDDRSSLAQRPCPPDTLRRPYPYSSRPGHRYPPNPRCRSSSPEATTSPGHATSGLPVQRLIRVAKVARTRTARRGGRRDRIRRTRVAGRTRAALVRVTDVARTRVADRRCREPLRRPDTPHPHRPYTTRPGHIGHPNPYDRSSWPSHRIIRTRVARRTPLQRLVRVTDIARTRVADRCCRRPLRRSDTTHPDRPVQRLVRVTYVTRARTTDRGCRRRPYRPDTRRQPYPYSSRPGRRCRPNPALQIVVAGVPLRHPDTPHPH